MEMGKESGTVKQKRIPLSAVFNPSALISEHFENVPWPFAFSVSGFCFLLLFLQTGIDRLRAGTAMYFEVFQLVVVGTLFGTLGIFIIALIASVISKLFGSKWGIGQSMRAVALSYGSALAYMIIGIIINLIFKWNTAVAFGVTGMLWTMGPLYGVFRNMVGEKTIPSIIITAVCGSLVLFGWYALSAV
ncbi:hypothetical protein [Mahella australiensis]|uniref:Yip1 domain-containing protein n=1 Tax=Mahella australiensis (strain DSM 15567 / CIP 107919 / 50-1 BON) TaxID=697281 RepID=F3ZX60_MAHA5|nr:hypothetical protein [Mahella australiensis]AEE95509.1 hypothetical protein Mahau_0292 [Mahella australiensis 50-1 BON]